MGEKINPWRKCHTEHYWAYYFVGYDKTTDQMANNELAELAELQAAAEAGTLQLRDLTPEDIALHKKAGLL
jgi:hypothetical protein